MQAVRCVMCGLLVSPGDYGLLKIEIAGHHAPELYEGFALPSETPICSGSEMLGYVEEVKQESEELNHA